MGIQEEYDLMDARKAALVKAVTEGLSDREKDLLYSCLRARVREVMRKRSWRPSERAAAMADIETLGKQLGLGSIL